MSEEPRQAPTVTVAVFSRNEADLLPACLARVGWADELLVFDMESSDATAEVARAHGATVLPAPLVPIVEMVRQHAVDAASSDWVLFVDPDEVLPESFLEQIRPHLERSEAAGYRLPFREVAFGEPLHHTFVGARKLALVRRGRTTYADDIVAHQEPRIEGEVADLMQLEPVEHHSRRDVASATEKALRYGVSGGTAGADMAPDDLFLLPRLWFRAVVLNGAWRDGRRGVAAISLVVIGEYVGALTQWERAGCPDPRLRLRTRLGLRVVARLRRASRLGHRLVARGAGRSG